MTEPVVTVVRPPVITDSSGCGYVLVDGVLKPSNTVHITYRFVSLCLAPLKKGLVDPMDFVAMLPLKRHDRG
jgi:hypothetical protein